MAIRVVSLYAPLAGRRYLMTHSRKYKVLFHLGLVSCTGFRFLVVMPLEFVLLYCTTYHDLAMYGSPTNRSDLFHVPYDA
jgi:hypothetical protein